MKWIFTILVFYFFKRLTDSDLPNSSCFGGFSDQNYSAGQIFSKLSLSIGNKGWLVFFIL